MVICKPASQLRPRPQGLLTEQGEVASEGKFMQGTARAVLGISLLIKALTISVEQLHYVAFSAILF